MKYNRKTVRVISRFYFRTSAAIYICSYHINPQLYVKKLALLSMCQKLSKTDTNFVSTNSQKMFQ